MRGRYRRCASQQGNALYSLVTLGIADERVHSLAERLLTFGLGRGIESYDKCNIDAIVRNVARNDYRFSALVLEVAKSEPFRMRTVKGGNP